MKINHLFALVFLLLSFSVVAQDFEENFDSYSVGDNVSEVSPYFETWDFDPFFDTKITDEASSSGNNAIRIFNDGQGYLTDLELVLSADEPIEQGVYEFGTKMMIPKGKKAYFRLDAGRQDNFENYTLQCENGTCMFYHDDAFDPTENGFEQKFYFGFPYEDDTWFDLELTHYLSEPSPIRSSTVSVKVNGECYGQFTVGYFFIADYYSGFNIWARDGVDFYIDDVSFKKIADTYELNHQNLFNIENRIYGEEGANFSIHGSVFFQLALPFVDASSYTVELDKDGEVTEYRFDQLIENNQNEFFCIRPDFQFDPDLDVTLRLSKVDDVALLSNEGRCETENRLFFETIPEERKRGVFVEGIIDNKNSGDIGVEEILNRLQEKFPNHVSAVSLHNSAEDPLPTYVNIYEGLNMFNGFFLFDKRKQAVFLADFEKRVLDKVFSPAVASLRTSASFEAGSLQLMTEVHAFEDIPQDWNLVHILIQDNFQGEGESYDLTNLWGELVDLPLGSCDYQYAPAVIPASEAVYNRIPLEYNQDVSISAMSPEEKKIYALDMSQTDLMDIVDDLKIITLLVNSDDEVENSKTTTLSKALNIDLSTGTEELAEGLNSLSVRNRDNNTVEVEYESVGAYSITLSDIQGRPLMILKNVDERLNYLDVSGLLPGAYVVSVRSGEGVKSEMVVRY